MAGGEIVGITTLWQSDEWFQQCEGCDTAYDSANSIKPEDFDNHLLVEKEIERLCLTMGKTGQIFLNILNNMTVLRKPLFFLGPINVIREITFQQINQFYLNFGKFKERNLRL